MAQVYGREPRKSRAPYHGVPAGAFAVNILKCHVWSFRDRIRLPSRFSMRNLLPVGHDERGIAKATDKTIRNSRDPQSHCGDLSWSEGPRLLLCVCTHVVFETPFEWLSDKSRLEP